jgi:hypothetical protein
MECVLRGHTLDILVLITQYAHSGNFDDTSSDNACCVIPTSPESDLNADQEIGMLYTCAILTLSHPMHSLASQLLEASTEMRCPSNNGTHISPNRPRLARGTTLTFCPHASPRHVPSPTSSQARNNHPILHPAPRPRHDRLRKNRCSCSCASSKWSRNQPSWSGRPSG